MDQKKSKVFLSHKALVILLLHTIHFVNAVAGKPNNLKANISESNSTHVNITVSWESPADPVTGYVIYYQSKRGPDLNKTVSGGEIEEDILIDLPRKTVYYISILALLSENLPSPLVHPYKVIGKSLTSPVCHSVLVFYYVRSTTGSSDFTQLTHCLTK